MSAMLYQVPGRFTRREAARSDGVARRLIEDWISAR